MRHYKKIENDYVYCIGTGPGGEEITQEEYGHILSMIHDRPAAEPGYIYRLKADMTWELCEEPVIEDDEAEATDADYLAALAELGVTMDEEA